MRHIRTSRFAGRACRRAFAVSVLAAVACVVGLVAAPTTAVAWFADFFDGDVSGQAIYEDMAIHSEAVYYQGVTYIAYQGKNLDPYVIAYDHSAEEWIGPVRVGTNPLTSKWNPDDSHGAPALLVDPSTGYLHVFWGAHQTQLLQATSTRPEDISAWDAPVTVASSVTYPQVFVDAAGTAHLFCRFDKNSDGLPDDMSTTLDRGGWVHYVSPDGGRSWLPGTTVVRGDPSVYWYAHFEPASDGGVHGVLTAWNRQTPYERRGVFYLRLDGAGVARDIEGEALPLGGAATDYSVLSETTATVVADIFGEYQNQLVVADDGTGDPGVLFVSGAGDGPDTYRWMFATYEAGEWRLSEVASTDHFMDASTVEFVTPNRVEAFLTRGGTRGESDAQDRYRDRGGNIEHWVSEDRGATWSRQAIIAAADVDRGVVYNDPQVVSGYVPDARVVFTEWDNDAGNMVHRVFLWGEDGYKQHEFFPDIRRLSGLDRYETSAAISRESFPLCADTVVIASGTAFADGLVGAPLARAYCAPLLLSGPSALPPSVEAEVRRLKPARAIVLGGTASVGRSVDAQLKGMGLRVQRIDGADRYEVAANVAECLRLKVGGVRKAIVVSGETFADALSVAPVAASAGYPVVLARRTGLPTATRDVIASLGVTETIVVGGPASVPDDVALRLPGPARIGGADRYEVAANVARLGLDGGFGEPGRLSMTRFCVASGTAFPDALSGGVLAARTRGPVLLVRPPGTRLGGVLPDPIRLLLDERGYRVLRAYVLGGERSVSPEVANQVAGALYDRQYD